MHDALPSVLRHNNLQRQLVRKWTPDRHAVGSHACSLQTSRCGIQIQQHPRVQVCVRMCRVLPPLNGLQWLKSRGDDCLQRLDAIHSTNRKRSVHPRGMPLVTCMLASSEQAWEPMASSDVNSCRKRAPYTPLRIALNAMKPMMIPSVFEPNLKCQSVSERQPERNVRKLMASSSGNVCRKRAPYQPMRRPRRVK
jgi:hypothetical protein